MRAVAQHVTFNVLSSHCGVSGAGYLKQAQVSALVFALEYLAAATVAFFALYLEKQNILGLIGVVFNRC